MRTILQHRRFEHAGVELVFAKEKVGALTDWSFTSSDHTFIVHLGGRLQRLETAFECGVSASTLPEAGDIWAAPGGERYSAFASLGDVAYCEVRLGGARFVKREMEARIAHRDEFLHALAQRGASLAGADDNLSAMLLTSIAEAAERHVALCYLGSGAPLKGGANRISAGVKAALKTYIEENPEADHSLRTLSAMAGVPEHGFIDAFRRAFGVSPHQFVIDRRIEIAKRLLRSGAMPVTEVAMRTGFSTPSHFSTAFRRRVGVSPRIYRNNV